MIRHLSKIELRKSIRLKVAALSVESKKLKAMQVAERIRQVINDEATDNFQDMIFGCYAAFADEVDWLPFCSGEWTKQVAYPKPCSKKVGSMTFVVPSSSEDLVFESWQGNQILTPARGKEVVPAIIFVPGLAFDRSGGRVGRGKGYFDKYLENYNGIKVGVCFSEQLVSSLPIEEHDQPMNYVVTDEAVIKITREFK